MYLRIIARLMRLLICLAMLAPALPSAYSQMTDKLLPENQMEEALIGTTWTGMVFGEKFDYLFLDDHMLVYRTRKGVFAKSKWGLSQGKLSITILNNPDYPLQLSFSGELNGKRIVGTAQNYVRASSERKIDEATWVLDPVSEPIPEMLEAVPQHRSIANSLPPIDLSDFVGTYISEHPSDDGLKGPPVKYEVRCELFTGCNMVIVGRSRLSHDAFSSVGPMSRDEYLNINRSLEAAKRNKLVVLQEEPWFSKVIEFDSKILNCLALRRTKQTGRVTVENALCRLDNNPWNEPVLLYRAAFLDHCGSSICRYGFVPMYKKTPTK